MIASKQSNDTRRRRVLSETRAEGYVVYSPTTLEYIYILQCCPSPFLHPPPPLPTGIILSAPSTTVCSRQRKRFLQLKPKVRRQSYRETILLSPSRRIFYLDPSTLVSDRSPCARISMVYIIARVCVCISDERPRAKEKEKEKDRDRDSDGKDEDGATRDGTVGRR